MFKHIPDEMKQLKQWVCWCGDKLPKNAYTGGNAQSNNPETWADFETALGAIDKFNFDGLGFMFNGNTYFGVDLDKCLDNQDFIDEFVETLQSYTEISRSGNGIHIICKGSLPDGARRKGCVEMYSNGRYFIMTGNIYNEKLSEIVDCTESIKILHAKYLHTERPKIAKREITPLDLSEEEIVDRARNCKTGGAFQLLYSGNWEGIYDSQSTADLAFCNQLAFWTQCDEIKMDRIFRSSGLYRKKWDELRGKMKYGELTIAKAISGCNKVYEPVSKEVDKNLAVNFFGAQTTVKPTVSYDSTDSGNAKRLFDRFGSQLHYSYNRKKWLYWSGKSWVYDDSGEIKKLADVIIDDMKKESLLEKNPDIQEAKLKFAQRTANSNPKTAMIKEAEHLQGIPISMDDLDSFTDYLNVQNGIINLRNGELIPSDPHFLLTKISTCELDNSNKTPTMWLKFINDITNGDKDLQHYLQKCVGYSLSGSIKEQCLFFVYGVGNNGKSTFIETIADMLGTYGANVQPETLMMSKNQGGVTNDIARLKSIRMAIAEEATEGVRLNEGLIKHLTGGGKTTCRFLYGEDFEYTPEFKIWIATNHKPVIHGTDVGIWRRIRMIPFEVNIPKEKVDKSLKFKLRKEMPAILKWAVDGCIMWQKEGLIPPKAVADATKEYKSEMDILQTFMEECVTIDYSSNVTAQDLYKAYSNWAMENKEFVMKSRKFFLDIGKKIEKGRTGSGSIYKNIKLNKPLNFKADMFKQEEL